MNRNIAVFGIYPTQDMLENGIGMLKGAGFRDTDIAALLPANYGNKDLAVTKGSRAGAGFTAGALIGAIVGGLVGYMFGADYVYVQGFEAIHSAEPWVAALAGAGALAILFGLIGALMGASVPVYEAFRFDGRTRRGGMLLSVHCDNKQWSTLARGILRQSGARQFAATGQRKADFASTDRPVEPARVPTNLNTLDVRDVKVVRGPEKVADTRTFAPREDVRDFRAEPRRPVEREADQPVRWSH